MSKSATRPKNGPSTQQGNPSGKGRGNNPPKTPPPVVKEKS